MLHIIQNTKKISLAPLLAILFSATAVASCPTIDCGLNPEPGTCTCSINKYKDFLGKKRKCQNNGDPFVYEKKPNSYITGIDAIDGHTYRYCR